MNAGDEREEWRAVVNYEGRYEVSNLGRVRGLVNRKGNPLPEPRILKLAPNPQGYLVIRLHCEGLSRTRPAHRLVAAAFLGASGLDVNHINGVKSDNRLANLEWATRSENIAHARDILGVQYGHKGGGNHKAKLTQSQVDDIRALLAQGAGCTDLAKKYQVTTSAICHIKKGRTWSK